ncbi:hypothetical protein WJX81_003758 [Elliptochloris bilobata]|uniref:Arp2/3 complex 34 kDa subunit n=1 Tax=Elliptochloris bilobata TaxID=381761 RepID=A0AAW1R3U2_9CHLO
MLLPLPRSSVILQQILSGVDVEQPRSSCISELHEFDDCRYKVERLKEAPDVLTASFGHTNPLPAAAEAALRRQYEGISSLAFEAETNYQLTLHVSAQTLRGLPDARRAAVLDKLAAVRLYAVGAQLRQLLQALAAGELTSAPPQAVLARPGAPFFVRAEGEALTALFPIRQSEGREGALAAAFVQEFAGANRAASCGDAPRCIFTLPGQAPPFLLEDADLKACDCGGGFLAFVIEARHVAAPERVDAVAWSLLTFYAHIDVHVKRFKGLVHNQLRQRADAMLAVLERASFAAREQKTRKTSSGRIFIEQAAARTA